MDASPTLSHPLSPPLKQANSLLRIDSFAPGEAFHVDDLLDLPFDDDASCPAIEDGLSGSFSQHSMELFACDTGKLGLYGWNERIGFRAAAGESVVGQEIAQSSVSELCMPPDELADQLEWLSAFVEDSSYSADATLASLGSSDCLSAGKVESDALSTREAFQSRSPVSVLEQPGGSFSERLWCLSPSFTVPGRARSKRSRTGGRVWSLDTLISISVDNKIGSGDKMFMDCSGENFLSSSEQEGDVMSVRPTKKTKKASVGSKSVDASLPRKCAHCLVQKTPQWRAGPMGPKTLCNACGVRYKSGRLVPEYRPAGSPSFVTEVHSNSHKRILEMRRLKEFDTCEEHKVIVQVSECEGDAEEECLGARPGAVSLTLVEQAPQGQEDNCHSQYGSREKDDSQEENSANSQTDFPGCYIAPG